MKLLELIKDACEDLGQDYPAIAERLNAATEMVNPDAGKKSDETKAATITLKMVMASVPPVEMAAIYAKLPAFSADLKTAIDGGDRDYLTWLLAIAMATTDDAGKALISPETLQKLQALLMATTTTTTTAPNTLPGPSLAEAAGLGVITPQMVQATLN
jgi:hypothetical protein